MNCNEINYGGMNLLAAEVPPSRYLFAPQMSAKLLSWQIAMADNSTREILFSEIDSAGDISQIGSKVFFNLRASPLVSELHDMNFENSPFEKITKDDYEISFSQSSMENSVCVPKITYRLSELYFRLELSLLNTGTFPIYWRPAAHFFMNVPWNDETHLEKYMVKCLAKKRLRISDSLCVVSSAKCAEKISLDVLGDCSLGIAQLKDSKIWVGTPNEEEGISFIFGNKTQKSVMLMRKTQVPGKLEFAFLSDMPDEHDSDITNGDLRHHSPIQPGRTDIFVIEISAY